MGRGKIECENIICKLCYSHNVEREEDLLFVCKLFDSYRFAPKYCGINKIC